MANLIYIGVPHATPEVIPLQQFTEKEKEAINKYHESLIPYYDIIIRRLSKISVSTSIHKVYVEGITDSDIEDTLKKEVKKCSIYWPVSALVKGGAKLMPTENTAIREIERFIFKAFPTRFQEVFDLLETTQINQHLPTFKETLKCIYRKSYKKMNEDLEDLCQGEKFFDTVRLRDKYIADNINKTLKDDENGVLIIGEAHKVDQCLKEIDSKIQIFYLTKPISYI